VGRAAPVNPLDPKSLLPPTRIGSFSLAKLKTAGGEETARFEAVLLHDGKAVARVSNGGHGGQCDVHPLDKVRPYGIALNELVEQLESAAQQMPPIPVSGGRTILHSWDSLLLSLVENTKLVRSLKRSAKSKTVFFDPTKDEVGVQFSIFRLPPTDPRVKAWLEKECPGYVILNDALRDA
jgi:hypothetical protein